MSTYYTTHPNLSVTALVDAPTTEKARTTFLDYLERRNLISRADRSYWRRNMVAERMDDPRDVQADIELFYGYQEGGQHLPPSMTQVPTDPGVRDGSTEERRDAIQNAAADRIFRQYETGKFVPEKAEGDELSDEEEQEDGFEDAEQPRRPSVQQVAKDAPTPKLSPIQQVSLGRSSK